MKTLCHRAFAVLLLCGLHGAPPARAAETYHTCTGFIPSLPTTISTQGVWCLNKDLSTAQTSGEAINIATNNVTIDCNGFKIGGLAAGPTSMTLGVYAGNRQNATVRNCNIRGFRIGIFLGNSGGGHLVEDNRLDNNLQFGISVIGSNNLVRRNAVFDTGGFGGTITGILAAADVLDNSVVGVKADTANALGDTFGISLVGRGSEATGNHVSGLTPGSGKAAFGIGAGDDYQTLSRNRVEAGGSAATDGIGLFGQGTANTFCMGNLAFGFATGMSACHDVGGNAAH